MSVEKPVVGIIMGSRSDWPTLKAAAAVLDALQSALRDARRLGARDP